MRPIVAYSPALALFVAGVVLIWTAPYVNLASCGGCPGTCAGTVCTAREVNPVGPLLIMGAGVYAGIAYLARRLGRGIRLELSRPR